jgi:hypothetical protein
MSLQHVGRAFEAAPAVHARVGLAGGPLDPDGRTREPIARIKVRAGILVVLTLRAHRVVEQEVDRRQRPEVQAFLVGEGVSVQPGRDEGVEVAPVDRWRVPFRSGLKPIDGDVQAVPLGEPDQFVEGLDRGAVAGVGPIEQLGRHGFEPVRKVSQQVFPLHRAQHRQGARVRKGQVVNGKPHRQPAEHGSTVFGDDLDRAAIVAGHGLNGDRNVKPQDRSFAVGAKRFK